MTTATVPKAIHHLLMEEEQVSLSGIGTLQLLPQPATVNAIQRQLAPPAERVTFNSNLVLDDGRILRALTASGELSETAAREALDEFLRTMRENLDAGRTFVIEGIGRFHKPHNAQILFTPTDGNFNKSSFGLPTLALRPIVRSERHVREALDPLTAGPSPAPASTPAKGGLLYNEQLRRGLWYVFGALAAILLLAAIYRVWQIASSGGADDEDSYVRIERDDPPPRLPADRVNVAPGPKPAPVDADVVAPAPPPRIDDENRGEDVPLAGETQDPDVVIDVTTPATGNGSEITIDVSENDGNVVVDVAPRSANNVAMIATGMFGSQRNVDKNISRIEAAGFESFARPEGRLTRIGVRLEYDTEEELFSALNRIRRLYSDSFVMEINGEAQRIQ